MVLQPRRNESDRRQNGSPCVPLTLHGRTHVATEDIQALAKPVLRHRVVVNFAAESEGVTQDDIVERLLAITPTKEDELTSDARFQKIFAS